MLKLSVTVLALALGLTGCAISQEENINHSNGPILFNKDTIKELSHIRPTNIQAEPNEIFIRKVNSRIEDSTRVSIKQKQIPIAEAVVKAKDGVNLIAKDKFIDITKTIDVFVDGMKFSDYLDYLSAATGYHLEIDGKNVVASSYKELTINMASIASNQSSTKKYNDGDDERVSLEVKNNTDKWNEVLDLCRSMLNVDAPISSNAFKPYCNGVRSLGLITAAGDPEKVSVLERILNDTDQLAKQVIMVEVKWFDISLGKRESLKQTTLAIKNNASGLASFGTSMKIFEEGMGTEGIKTKDVNVGLDFLITPRVLGNKIVELDIFPTVSSLKGWREAEVEMSTAELPDIEFTNFATQVLTRSDKPVQVGEFSNAEISTLLIRQEKGSDKATLTDLLSQDGNKMRKIIMTVNPKIISGI